MSDHEARGRLAALPTRFGEPLGEVMLEPAAAAVGRPVAADPVHFHQ
jgi:hypothetical protein